VITAAALIALQEDSETGREKKIDRESNTRREGERSSFS